MSGVRILTVGETEGESRLDRWLKKRLPEVSQVQIEKCCAAPARSAWRAAV